MWGCHACVLLGRVSGSTARRAGSKIRGFGTCHIIETLCSPFRRFESELNKTALTGYAARDLLPLSLDGARSRLGPLLTPLPRSKGRTCALWVLLIVKAMNWLFCAGWIKRGRSLRHNRILSVQRGHVFTVLVGLFAKQGILLSPLPLLRGLCFFMQVAIGVDPEIPTLENNLTTLLAHIFSWIVAPGSVQNAADSQAQAEILRCYDVLPSAFSPAVLSFLLGKLRGVRDDRLGALLTSSTLHGSHSPQL